MGETIVTSAPAGVPEGVGVAIESSRNRAVRRGLAAFLLGVNPDGLHLARGYAVRQRHSAARDGDLNGHYPLALGEGHVVLTVGHRTVNQQTLHAGAVRACANVTHKSVTNLDGNQLARLEARSLNVDALTHGQRGLLNSHLGGN